jgi:hypothetical protein
MAGVEPDFPAEEEETSKEKHYKCEVCMTRFSTTRQTNLSTSKKFSVCCRFPFRSFQRIIHREPAALSELQQSHPSGRDMVNLLLQLFLPPAQLMPLKGMWVHFDYSNYFWRDGFNFSAIHSMT